MTISNPTRNTLSAFTVRFVVEVYSDRPVEYLDGFVRGITKDKGREWYLDGTKGDQGVILKSRIITVSPDESIQSVLDDITPRDGFYKSNTRIYCEFNPEVNISINEVPF